MNGLDAGCQGFFYWPKQSIPDTVKQTETGPYTLIKPSRCPLANPNWIVGRCWDHLVVNIGLMI